MTIQERKEALATPVWDYKLVALYCGCKKSKAFEIMKKCKEELNGRVLFNEHGVKRNSVLAYLNTSVEQERYIIQQLEEEQT